MFKYLIFVNDAKEPIAGFAFREYAVAWVGERSWGKNYNLEIREGDTNPPSDAATEREFCDRGKCYRAIGHSGECWQLDVKGETK